jgi:hypothetical protein
MTPSEPRYFDTRRESGKLVANWNPIVPEPILTRAWAEVG